MDALHLLNPLVSAVAASDLILLHGPNLDTRVNHRAMAKDNRKATVKDRHKAMVNSNRLLLKN